MRSVLLAAVSVVLVFGLGACKTSRVVSGGSAAVCVARMRPETSAVPMDVLVLSDNQEHNVFAGALRSLSGKAEAAITPVAIRSPQVNLWSRLVLEHFVQDALEGPDAARLVLHLGDAADVACTNEFDTFVTSMQRATDGRTPWLWTPGNHDSFMAGNLNSYVAKSAKESFKDAYEKEWTTWAGACASPDATSQPLTKELLLQRYLKALEAQGVQFESSSEMEEKIQCTVWRGKPAVGTPLASLGFSVIARECARLTTVEDKFIGPWESFIAQRVEVAPGVDVLLLDTTDLVASDSLSVFRGRGAAQRGLLRKAQQDALGELIAERGSDSPKRLFVAMGHSPWNELEEGSREYLLSKGITAYASGHTHIQSSVLEHPGKKGRALFELNVASTTDWPMETLRMGAARTAGGLALRWRVHGAGQPQANVSEAQGPAAVTQPSWLQACAALESWKLADTEYQHYVNDKDRFEPYERALSHAEKVLFEQAAEALTPPCQTPVRDFWPTRPWQRAAVLDARARRLEARMREAPEAAQYGLCQVYWASQATQHEWSFRDLVFKVKPPTRWAWEQAGVELNIPAGDDSCPTP